MALGIYKAGQGYWVRVLTAALAGVLVLAACAWAWNQVLLISIPRPTWVLPVSAAEGAAAPGQTVTLQGDVDGNPGLEAIGTAEVIAQETGVRGQVTLRVGRLHITQGSPSQIQRVAPGDGAGAATISGMVTGPQGIPVIQPLYLQVGVASVILTIGAVIVYWLVGAQAKTAEFLIATDGEMKKVNWSTRKGVVDSTWVVILWSVILAGGLFIVDAAFSMVFNLIGVLDQ